MTGEIIIFERGNNQQAGDSKNAALLAAIDSIAPRALKSVARNEKDTDRVRHLLTDVKAAAKQYGRAGAINYLAQVNALAA